MYCEFTLFTSYDLNEIIRMSIACMMFSTGILLEQSFAYSLVNPLYLLTKILFLNFLNLILYLFLYLHHSNYEVK